MLTCIPFACHQVSVIVGLLFLWKTYFSQPISLEIPILIGGIRLKDIVTWKQLTAWLITHWFCRQYTLYTEWTEQGIKPHTQNKDKTTTEQMHINRFHLMILNEAMKQEFFLENRKESNVWLHN